MNFCMQIPMPEGMTSGHKDSLHDSTMLEEDQAQPDCIYTADGPKLTDRGKLQVC